MRGGRCDIRLIHLDRRALDRPEAELPEGLVRRGEDEVGVRGFLHRPTKLLYGQMRHAGELVLEGNMNEIRNLLMPPKEVVSEKL